MADLEVRGQGALRVITLPAALDDPAAAALKTVLAGVLNDGGRRLLCDASRTRFASGRAIEILTEARNVLRKINGELGFLHALPELRHCLEKAGAAYHFRFYDMEESVSVLVMNTLVKYFHQYEDLGDIRSTRTGESVRVEVVLRFDGGRTMREVQRLMDAVTQEVKEQQPHIELLLIAAAQPEESAREEPVAVLPESWKPEKGSWRR